MGETVFTSLLMKNVLINSFNQEPKNENGDRQQKIFQMYC